MNVHINHVVAQVPFVVFYIIEEKALIKALVQSLSRLTITVTHNEDQRLEFNPRKPGTSMTLNINQIR